MPLADTLVATEADLVVVVVTMEGRLRVLGWSPILALRQSMLAMISKSYYEKMVKKFVVCIFEVV